MAEIRNLEWTKDWGLNEIYSGGLQMALCSPPDENGKHKKATTFVTCKDFFQDAVQATHLNHKADIFSFEYDPANAPPLSFDRTRILVANNIDKDFESKIEGVVDFLNQFEKRIHLIRTKAYKCDPTPDKFKKSGGVYLFEGSGRWMIAPPMISLYTLLIRCGFAHKKGEDFDKTCKGIMNGTIKTIGGKGDRHSGCYDDHYLKDAQPGIKALLEHGYSRLFYKDAARNFPKEIDIDTMHNCCGIVGYSQKQVKAKMPYWYRLWEPKKKKPAAKKKVAAAAVDKK
jgi:hypothetical protein